MKKVLNIKQAGKESSRLRKQGKSIVLVGGVFDILHIGHVKFLEKAKREGDLLFVLLESDESVREKKGKSRPLNNQKDRSEVLAGLSSIDFVVKLQGVLKDDDYDKIVKKIYPDVLATTVGDSYIFHKVRQAKLVGAKLKTVIKRVKNKSTTNLTEELA